MADQTPTPLSDAEIARIRAENKAQKQTSGATSTPLQQPNAPTSPTVPTQPSTVDTQYATNQRENIGTYRNLGDNGYSAATGMSQTAINAQKANQYAYDQQQAQKAPTPEQFAQMNRNATTVGEAAKAGVTDQKIIGSFKDTGNIPLSMSGQTPQLAQDQNKPTGEQAAQTTPTTTTTTQAGATADQQETPQDFVSKFMSKLSTSTDQFLNNTLSGYGSILDDIKKLTETQIAGATKFAQDMQTTLQKREEFYQAEYDAQKALTQQNADQMMSIASQEKDNAQKQNELAAKAADADYSNRLQMAEENQGRYLGFLTSKFDAMGMADSSAGLRSIGKYLAVGEMAINQVVQDKDTARSMYLAKGQEIATTFFKQAYQIEQTKQQNLLQLNNQFFEQSMKIMDAKISTEDTKNKQIMQASKEYNDTRLQITNDSFNKVMQVTQQKLQEAQFQNQVIQEAIKNNQWERQFGFSSDMAQKQFGLDLSKFDFEKSSTQFTQALQLQQEQRIADAQLTEQTGQLYINGKSTGIRAMNGLSYDMQKDQYLTSATGEVYHNGQPTGVITENRRQFESNYALNYAQFSSEDEKRKFQMDLDKINAGISSSAILSKYMDPQDVLLNGIKVKEGDGKITTFGEKLAGAIETAANNVNGAFQCVQFVRKAIPDLPTDLFSLADKVRTLTQGDKSIQAPKEGAVVVLDWKSKVDAGKSADQYPGHVAIVTDVDEKSRTFTITDYNGSGGSQKLGKRVISMDNPQIKGYWMSSNMQGIGATQKSVLQGIPKEYLSSINQVSGSFENEPQIKGFQQIQAARNNIRSISNDTKNPSDDQSLIYAFAKVMDPNSVVREGEYKTVQEYAQSLFNKYGTGMQQAFTGEGFLSKQARENIKKTIEGKYNVEKELYTNVRNQYAQKIDSLAGKNIGNELLQDYAYNPSSETVKVKNNSTGEVRSFNKNDVQDLPDGFSIIQ